MTARDSRTGVVLFVSHIRPSLGIEKVALDLLPALRAQRDVELVCLAEEDDAAAEAGGRNLGSPLRGWRRVFSLSRARRFSKSESRTIILAGAWAALPFLAVAPRRVARRSIVWEHSFDAAKVETNSSLRVLRRLARVLYRRAALVVAVSEPLAVDIRSWFGGTVVTIPNMIPDVQPRSVQVMRKDDVRRVVVVGSLTKTKNQRLAVDALQALPPTYTLTFLGTGTLREELEARAVELGIEERVRFEGFVDDVYPYLASADVLLHPALGETFGVALFEAASIHVPVVALDRGVMREFVPLYVPGVVCAPDARSVAGAITRAITLREDDEMFTAADRRRESAFGVDTIIDGWTAVLGIAERESHRNG